MAGSEIESGILGRCAGRKIIGVLRSEVRNLNAGLFTRQPAFSQSIITPATFPLVCVLVFAVVVASLLWLIVLRLGSPET